MAFIAANAWFLLNYENWMLVAAPLVLGILLAAVYATDKLLLSVFLLAPLSLNLEDLGDYGIGFYLPTEPILLLLTALFVFDQLRRPSMAKGLGRHPISVSIYIYLIWILITSITSTEPDVSFKFLISRVWFFVPIYFYGVRVFKERANRRFALWAYLIALTGVVIYTLIRHAAHNFDEDPGHWVMTPFYKDHTSYGALIALFIPIAVGFLFEKGRAFWYRPSLYTILTILLVGLIFSYTRAAWVSLVAGLGVMIAIKMRVKWYYLMVVTGVASVFAIAQFDQIMMDMERNRTDSSDDFAEHMTSATNISTDASNLERINRWNSAIAMWEERPLVGWGPGTYAFKYAPFQHPDDMTIISTNFGDRGNAHSEYLGALAETGFPGAITFIVLVVAVFYTAVITYYKVEHREDKWMLLMIIVGLSTYFIHSALNNYLDTDKAAVPVWGMVAMVVALQHNVTERRSS